MAIPITDPRHPGHVFVAPIVPGTFAEAHARRPRQCADCGLLNVHRPSCPSAPETCARCVDEAYLGRDYPGLVRPHISSCARAPRTSTPKDNS